MKNKKMIIAILIVLIVIVAISITILLRYKNNSNSSNKNIEHTATPPTPVDPIEINKTLQRVSVRNNFYVVKNCVTQFFTYCNSIRSSSNIDNKQANLNAVYNLLDEKYISYKNVTLDNLETLLPNVNLANINISDMYVFDYNENVSVYFVYGYTTSSSPLEFSLMVNVDMLHRTYNVLLEDCVKEMYNNIEIGKTVNMSVKNTIPQNAYNTFKFETIADNIYVSDLVEHLKNNIIYNLSAAYEKLDENTKKENYPTIDTFQVDMQRHIEDLSNLQLLQYQKTKYDNYTQYVCLCNDNKYYTFKETSPFNYTVVLDI